MKQEEYVEECKKIRRDGYIIAIFWVILSLLLGIICLFSGNGLLFIALISSWCLNLLIIIFIYRIKLDLHYFKDQMSPKV